MAKQTEAQARSQALLQERLKLFRAAARFEKPARVPHFCNVVTWKVFDAGYDLTDAMNNFDVMRAVVDRFFKTYTIDGAIDYGIRNQFNVTEVFGNGYYYYDKDAIGIKDHAHCTVDTLADYVRDPQKYIWEVALPAKYPDWADKDLTTWQRTMDEYLKYFCFIMEMDELAKGTYGIPALAPNNPSKGAIEFGIEQLYSDLLGIRQLSLGLRRNYDKIKSFVDAWDATHIQPQIDAIKKGKGPRADKYCFDASIMMLVHNILSPAQFEDLYWCHLEPMLDAYEAKGCSVRIFAEGSILRFADYFKKYKKGTLTFHIENDDPYEFRQALPNACIMGGITAEMMGTWTPDAVVARAEQLVKDLGTDGGFILSQDKMLSYRNDCTSENLHALCDFANGATTDWDALNAAGDLNAKHVLTAIPQPTATPGATSAYAAYPSGQTALVKQLKQQVKIDYIPFKFFPWGMLRKSMTPLLMKILIDG